MSGLTDKVVIATGAANNIGKATSLLLAERGARVALVDINADGLKATASSCGEFGCDVEIFTVDQRVSSEVRSCVQAVADRFGRIDSICNIAGVFPFAFIENMDDEFWHNVIQTNLTGVFYWCREVLPVMKAQGSGSIVNVTSGGAPALGAYGASKGGLTYFTQQALAPEAGPHGIRVNLVSPGPTVDSGGASPVGVGGPDSDAMAALAASIYTVEPRAVAEVIAFLASDLAEGVHGANYGVNTGGRVGPAPA